MDKIFNIIIGALVLFMVFCFIGIVWLLGALVLFIKIITLNI